MNPTRTKARRRPKRETVAIAAALAVCVTLALTTCGLETPVQEKGGSTPTPPVCPRVSMPDGRSPVDGCDAEAVMTAAVEVLLSYRPGFDVGQGAALQRGAMLLDPGYVRAIGTSLSALAPITGATWVRWRTADATVTAHARLTGDDHPPGTPTDVSRLVAVAQAVTGPDGSVIEARDPFAVYVRAVRPLGSGPWRVAEMSVR